jgi:two-component sensor histidine kinase
LTTSDASPTAIASAPADPGRRSRPSLRARLLAIVTLSLSPLLALSAVQALVDFDQASRQRRTILSALASDAAQDAEHAIQGARVLLEGLAAQDDVRAGGPACARALRNAILAVDEYSNLAAVDADGGFVCSAIAPPAPINVASESWFAEIREGASFVVGDAIVSALTGDLVLTAAVPAARIAGVEGAGAQAPPGALVASIKIAQIQAVDRRSTLPPGTRVALVDAQGRVIESGSTIGPAAIDRSLLEAAVADGAAFARALGEDGTERELVVSPLVEDDVFVVLTAPAPGLLAWFWVDAVGRVLLPLLMWALAILAVWLAAEQLILRWLTYLGRLAKVYGQGRLDVAPTKVRAAPHEIRELAETLTAMAASLHERETELADSLAQKEVLLKEIHHRVKNNLQIIVSLLNIQASDAAPEAQDALRAARERIFALSQVHKSLYESPDLDRVPLPSFFRDLISHLAAASGAEERGVVIDAEMPDASLPSERAASLALFVIEAITNSLKHAFEEGGGGGRVAVTGRLHADGRLEIRIEDSGRGFPAEAATDGVGGSLMTAFARQLGGAVERGASSQGGARVSLLVPLEPRAEGADGADQFEPADCVDPGTNPGLESSSERRAGKPREARR